MPMTRLDRRTEAVLGFSLTALYDQVQADEPLFGTAAASRHCISLGDVANAVGGVKLLAKFRCA